MSGSTVWPCNTTAIAFFLSLFLYSFGFAVDDVESAEFEWSSRTVAPDSLGNFVSNSDAELIRRFEKWFHSNLSSIREFALPILDNAEIHDFFQFKLLQSECFRLQVGELPDSILQAKLSLLDKRQHILDRIDSVFANESNLRAWQEIELACPALVNQCRNFLDSIAWKNDTATISFNIGAKIDIEVSPSGNSYSRDQFLRRFDEFAGRYLIPICRSGDVSKDVHKEGVLQLLLIGNQSLHAAIPIFGADGRELGEAVLSIHRNTRTNGLPVREE